MLYQIAIFLEVLHSRQCEIFGVYAAFRHYLWLGSSGAKISVVGDAVWLFARMSGVSNMLLLVAINKGFRAGGKYKS
jgi:hypothetical protein